MRSLGSRITVVLLAALTASLVIVVASASAAVGDIIERRVPGTAKGGLNRITTGPDGNIWFTDGGNNQIGRMTPAGAFDGFAIPTAGSSPIDITTGPDGALWFTEFVGNIGRITTDGKITEFPVLKSPGGAPANVFGITNGPDGALWFTTDCCDPGNPGKIGRITTSGAVTLFPLPTGTAPTVGITVGPDRNLWYPATFSSGFAEIQRMSVTGQILSRAPVPTRYADPSRLITGPDGNVWFTEQGAVGGNKQPGKIGRVSCVVCGGAPSNEVTEFTTPDQNPPSNPAGIAVGPDGNLWYTEYSRQNMDGSQSGGNRIGRITTAGQITEFPLPTQYARADGITGGPDGGVYFTESPNNFTFGQIGRIQALAPPVVAPPPAPAPTPAPVIVKPPVVVPKPVRVSVAGFTARISPRRDRRAPYRFTISGAVRRPAGIAASACKRGRVSVQTKVGSKTISTRRVTLKSNCTYRVAVTFSNRQRLGRGRLTLRVRFLGNARFKPAGPRTLSARAG